MCSLSAAEAVEVMPRLPMVSTSVVVAAAELCLKIITFLLAHIRSLLALVVPLHRRKAGAILR